MADAMPYSQYVFCAFLFHIECSIEQNKATVKAFQVHIKPPMGIFLGALAMGGAYHVGTQFSVL